MSPQEGEKIDWRGKSPPQPQETNTLCAALCFAVWRLYIWCVSVCVLLHMCLFKVYSLILAVLLSFICIGLHVWSFPSAFSAPGVQRQIVHCVERTTGIVEEHRCDPLTRPDDNQTSCQKDPCPAVWVFPGCQHRREQEELPINFHVDVVTVLLYFFCIFCLNCLTGHSPTIAGYYKWPSCWVIQIQLLERRIGLFYRFVSCLNRALNLPCVFAVVLWI